jgi:hypothetical protein
MRGAGRVLAYWTRSPWPVVDFLAFNRRARLLRRFVFFADQRTYPSAMPVAGNGQSSAILHRTALTGARSALSFPAISKRGSLLHANLGSRLLAD